MESPLSLEEEIITDTFSHESESDAIANGHNTETPPIKETLDAEIDDLKANTKRSVELIPENISSSNDGCVAEGK